MIRTSRGGGSKGRLLSWGYISLKEERGIGGGV